MSNIIKLKHGNSIPIPENLENYELGYAHKGLYIKDNDQIICLNGADSLQGIIPINKGGTGASNIIDARTNLGLGTLATANSITLSDNTVIGILPILKGGTGASTAAQARENLEITPINIGAAETEHTHNASEIVNGILPITNGGTGANTASSACANLGAARVQTPNNLIHTGNEITMVPSGYNGSVWFNYRTVGGTNGNITNYIFGNGSGGGYADISAKKITVYGVGGSAVAVIGSENSSFIHFSSGGVPFYFSTKIVTNGQINPYKDNSFNVGEHNSRWRYMYCKGISTANGDGLWCENTSGSDIKIMGISTNNNLWLGDGASFDDTNIYSPYYINFTPNRASASYKGHVVNLFREQSGSLRTVFRPSVNGTCYIGTTSYRWNTAFFTNAITASDLKEKDVIDDFDFKAEDFIMSLKPIAYRRKGEYDGGKRVHLGFGAQDVANTIKELNIGDMSIVQASIIKEKEVEREIEQGKLEKVIEKIEESYTGEEVDDEKLSWGLNYNEFIPIIVKVLQEQQEKIELLENKLSVLVSD